MISDIGEVYLFTLQEFLQGNDVSVGYRPLELHGIFFLISHQRCSLNQDRKP
jgi:hypothetical protein